MWIVTVIVPTKKKPNLPGGSTTSAQSTPPVPVDSGSMPPPMPMEIRSIYDQSVIIQDPSINRERPGVPPNIFQGMKVTFCFSCGSPILNPNFFYCPNCGATINYR